MRRSLAGLALVLAPLLSCGNDAPLSDSAAEQLRPQVSQIRELAEARQPELAAARLAELRTSVEVLRQAGDIDAARAQEILAAADAVEQQLLLITTTTTTATTTLPPPPTTKPDEDRKGDEKRGDDDKGGERGRG